MMQLDAQEGEEGLGVASVLEFCRGKENCSGFSSSFFALPLYSFFFLSVFISSLRRCSHCCAAGLWFLNKISRAGPLAGVVLRYLLPGGFVAALLMIFFFFFSFSR